jgi:hypothetical protein
MSISKLAGAMLVLGLTAGAAAAQNSPVITQVNFADNAPPTSVLAVNGNNGAVIAGCINIKGARPQCPANITISGPDGKPNGVFLRNSKNNDSFISYTKGAPTGNCQTMMVSISVGSTVVHTTCWASAKFTATVAADGSISFKQN